MHEPQKATNTFQLVATTSLNQNTPRKQSKTYRKILAISLVVVLLAAGIIGYSYTQITVSVQSVEFAGVTFREPNTQTLVSLAAGNPVGVVLSLLDKINIQVNLEIENAGLVPLAIPSTEFDIDVNGVRAGSGQSSDQSLNPRQSTIIPVRVEIPVARLQPLADVIVQSLGELDIEIHGKLKTNLLIIPIEIPFQKQQHISLVQIAQEKVQALRSGIAAEVKQIAAEAQQKVRSWASRVSGGQGDIPEDFTIISTQWLVGGQEVTSVGAGTRITATITIGADRSFSYPITLEIRQDRTKLTDVSFATRSYQVTMKPGETNQLSADFVPQSGLTVKGYFMSIRWSGKQWQMPSDYPPRLAMSGRAQMPQPPQINPAPQPAPQPVPAPAQSSNTLLIQDVFWTANSGKVSSVRSGTLVTANVVLATPDGFSGTVNVEVRRDLTARPDTTVITRDFTVNLNRGSQQTITLDFTAESGLFARGYFVKITWGSNTVEMQDSYPPRLSVR